MQSIEEICLRYGIPSNKIKNVKKYKYIHRDKNWTDEEVVQHWLNSKITFKQKCLNFGIPEEKVITVQAYKRNHQNENLTDEQIIKNWLDWQNKYVIRKELKNKGVDNEQIINYKRHVYRAKRTGNEPKSFEEYTKKTFKDKCLESGLTEKEYNRARAYRVQPNTSDIEAIQKVINNRAKTDKTLAEICSEQGISKREYNTIREFKRRRNLTDVTNEELITLYNEYKGTQTFAGKLKKYGLYDKINTIQTYKTRHPELSENFIICYFLNKKGIKSYINIFGEIVIRQEESKDDIHS